VGNEQSYEHKPYEFGDPFTSTCRRRSKNAIWRSARALRCGCPEDFEVERTEQTTRSATCSARRVALDAMRDNFLPAKKVRDGAARAHHEPVPREYFGLVSFGRVARDVKPSCSRR